ncbi:MAG: FAD-dependent oxidoreductase, partial [Petrimonas sp.]|nr:FAD-dependent oxidoreductase [Petrimonas sp.]
MKKTIFLLIALLVSYTASSQHGKTYDIVIYGGTSAGIAAAVEASRSGKSVIIINPDNHIGGLTTGGLGFTDIGNKMVIGGISREFYQRIREYYNKPEVWKWQEKSQFQEREQSSSPEG